ncbi:MAG: metallophosphoesterase [Clostridia bacterium]|nr:metallophosphoesterase [Clostridia bacterium]
MPWLILIAALLLLLLALFILYNNRFIVRSYTVETEKPIGEKRIVLLSDLHNKVYGEGNRPLLDCIDALKPDLIVIAGDLVDKRRPKISVGVAFAEGCAEIAPTYYVCGNHERERDNFDEICAKLKATKVLRNEYTEVCGLHLMGITDHHELPFEEPSAVLEEFEKLEGYKIVAVHRPADFFSEMEIRTHNVDLQLSGHTHAGVAHIPFGGAVFAPGEGILPKYSQGMFEEQGTTLIVGGGLGNTKLPIRLFNFPEIVEISIKTKKTLAK